jgi:molybdate transport system regulatory protein
MPRPTDASVMLRITLPCGLPMGPGKAAILRGIEQTGSIAATSRLTGMSYKRTWDLVNSLNKHFHSPLVITSKGGAQGGGASLSAEGQQVLSLYEQMLVNTNQAIAAELSQLESMTLDTPDS